MKPHLIAIACIAILLGACQNAQQPAVLPTQVIQPSPTLAQPTSTITPTAQPTPLPGRLTIPLDSLSEGIPWLPLDIDKDPMIIYIGVNVKLPPFDDVNVRKAFAAATDREAIAAIAERLYFENVRAATNLTPSETIGRDLYEAVGIPYDPAKAKEYLAKAGYADPAGFPPFTLLASMRGVAAPGFYQQVAEALAQMWLENLGVAVEVKVIGDFGVYNDMLKNDTPHLYFVGWGADLNDPDNFLAALLHSESDFNFGKYLSVQYDSLLARAARETDPEKRQLLYLQAEEMLTEEDAAVIPLIHTYFYRVN